MLMEYALEKTACTRNLSRTERYHEISPHLRVMLISVNLLLDLSQHTGV